MKKIYFYLRELAYKNIPYLYITAHLLKIRLQGADKYQRFLEKGAFWLERGVRYQIGQPVKKKRAGRIRMQYISGLYYDFRKRKITASFSDKPVKGWSERFLKKRSKGVKPKK